MFSILIFDHKVGNVHEYGILYFKCVKILSIIRMWDKIVLISNNTFQGPSESIASLRFITLYSTAT